jgi:hypothetical protein
MKLNLKVLARYFQVKKIIFVSKTLNVLLCQKVKIKN